MMSITTQIAAIGILTTMSATMSSRLTALPWQQIRMAKVLVLRHLAIYLPIQVKICVALMMRQLIQK